MNVGGTEGIDPAGKKGSGSDVRVRVLAAADRTVWIQLRHRLWPDHTLEELSQEADGFLQSEAGGLFRGASGPTIVLLAELASGQVVGFAEVGLRPFAAGCASSPVGYLEGWYVVPDQRRRNVGRALVLRAEEWARSQGCTEMASDAHAENALSRAAHQALGYEEVDPLVHFRRSLDAPGD